MTLKIRVRLCSRCLDGPAMEGHVWCNMCYAAWQREHREGPKGERDRAANRAYKQTNRARCSERERLRKAKVVVGDKLDRDVIYDNSDGKCGICGRKVSRIAFEVDHIIPLARNGVHTYDNTQPSHPVCNRKKYAS